MLYKIVSIKHSRGTLKGLDRQDDRYPMRIGRIISLDIDDISINFPLIIQYVRDSDGTQMRNLVLITSFVKSFEYIKDENGVINWINIVTENSIYEFKRVDDMNKYVKSYLQALEETLSKKYNISSHKAKIIIQDSYVIECLRDYPEESLHEDIETVADMIYEDYI